MGVVIVAINFAVIGVLYVWYLRLAAKWTLKISLSRKLCWIFYGLVLAASAVNILVSQAIERPAIIALGIAAHLLFGGWFFGKMAVNRDKVAPGFVGGLRLTGVAMTLLGITCGIFLAVPAYFLGKP